MLSSIVPLILIESDELFSPNSNLIHIDHCMLNCNMGSNWIVSKNLNEWFSCSLGKVHCYVLLTVFWRFFATFHSEYSLSFSVPNIRFLQKIIIFMPTRSDIRIRKMWIFVKIHMGVRSRKKRCSERRFTSLAGASL